MAERPVFEKDVFEKYLKRNGVPVEHREFLRHAWHAAMAHAFERAKETCSDYGDDRRQKSNEAERAGEEGMAFGVMGEMVGARECAKQIGLLGDRLLNEQLLTREGGS